MFLFRIVDVLTKVNYVVCNRFTTPYGARFSQHHMYATTADGDDKRVLRGIVPRSLSALPWWPLSKVTHLWAQVWRVISCVVPR